jgi:hypothetical protein
MKLEHLLNVVTGKTPLLSYEGDLWHVERLEIEQTDALHRPTVSGGRLNHYLTRTFSATLRHPDIKAYGSQTVELSGIVKDDGELMFPVRYPSDEDMQRQEMMEDRL